MLKEHLEHIDEVAAIACGLYGKEWKHIPGWSRDIWRDTVRRVTPESDATDVERCAVKAVAQWYKVRRAKAQAEAEEIDETPAETIADKPKRPKRT
jgi:hypothetical protein